MQPSPLSNQEPPYADAQRQVQRWLGRCMLMLQQYEKLLKACLHDMYLEASHAGQGEDGHAQFEVRRAYDTDALRTMTLGTLVKHFTGEFLAGDEPRPDEPELPDDGVLRMRFSVGFQMNSTEFDRFKHSLKELVDLRNGLVHHFIERFDLQTIAGCGAAQRDLEQVYSRILDRWEALRRIAQTVAEGSESVAQFFRSKEGHQLLMTGKLPLTNTPVVLALGKVLTRLAPTNEFVALNQVLDEMRAEHPEETPDRYGRSGWPELIHDTGAFEIQRSKALDGSTERQVRRRLPAISHPPSSASQTPTPSQSLGSISAE